MEIPQVTDAKYFAVEAHTIEAGTFNPHRTYWTIKRGAESIVTIALHPGDIGAYGARQIASALNAARQLGADDQAREIRTVVGLK